MSLGVEAETCTGVENATTCSILDADCVDNLKRNYNNWNKNDYHTGTACVKVIAQHICRNKKYESKTYITGFDPNTQYVCANGYVANKKIVNTAADERDVVSQSCDATLYVPELWEIKCSDETSAGDSSTNNNNTSNSNGNSDNQLGNSLMDENNDGNTNDKGQITGTTETKDTGVETYFIVLLIMVLISYLVLMFSKKKNLFEKI